MLCASYLICPSCGKMIGYTETLKIPKDVPLIIECSNCHRAIEIQNVTSDIYEVTPSIAKFHDRN